MEKIVGTTNISDGIILSAKNGFVQFEQHGYVSCRGAILTIKILLDVYGNLSTELFSNRPNQEIFADERIVATPFIVKAISILKDVANNSIVGCNSSLN